MYKMRKATFALLALAMFSLAGCSGGSGNLEEIQKGIIDFFKVAMDPRTLAFVPTASLQSLVPVFVLVAAIFAAIGAVRASLQILDAFRRNENAGLITVVTGLEFFVTVIAVMALIFINADLTEIGRELWVYLGLSNLETIRKSLAFIVPGENNGFNLEGILKDLVASNPGVLFSAAPAIAVIGIAFSWNAVFEWALGPIFAFFIVPITFMTGRIRFLLVHVGALFMWFVYHFLLGKGFEGTQSDPIRVAAGILFIAIPLTVLAPFCFWDFVKKSAEGQGGSWWRPAPAGHGDLSNLATGVVGFGLGAAVAGSRGQNQGDGNAGATPAPASRRRATGNADTRTPNAASRRGAVPASRSGKARGVGELTEVLEGVVVGGAAASAVARDGNTPAPSTKPAGATGSGGSGGGKAQATTTDAASASRDGSAPPPSTKTKESAGDRGAGATSPASAASADDVTPSPADGTAKDPVSSEPVESSPQDAPTAVPATEKSWRATSMVKIKESGEVLFYPGEVLVGLEFRPDGTVWQGDLQLDGKFEEVAP